VTNETQSATVQDAVTGQCDHIVGFILSDFPQFGGTDGLVRKSEGALVSEAFNFCPLCGCELTPSIQETLSRTGLSEHLQLL
jgi:hypothetical protein